MAYHARPCQFVTLSPLLLCIIHGYPPRPCVVVPRRPFSPSLPRRFYRGSASLVVPSPPTLPHPFPMCLGTSLSICLPFRLFSVVHLVPAGLPVARCFSLVLLVYLSLCLFPREDAMAWRRVRKAHRHHAISFIAAGPPRIQVSGGARDGDAEKKAIANGSRW